MEFITSLAAHVFNFFQDPFYVLFFLFFCIFIIFGRYQANNRKKIEDKFKNEEALHLSNIWVTHLTKAIGTRRNWFQVDLIFTPDSIFVFGNSRKMTLHTQYYSRLSPPPKRLVLQKKSFIPVDEIKLEGDNLIIRYTSPHWHRAKGTLILKKITKREESKLMCEMLAHGFGI